MRSAGSGKRATIKAVRSRSKLARRPGRSNDQGLAAVTISCPWSAIINSRMAIAGDAGRNLQILGLSPSVYILFTKLVRTSHADVSNFNAVRKIALFLCNHEIALGQGTIRSARPMFSPTLSTPIVDSVRLLRDSPKAAMGYRSGAGA